MSGGRKKSSGKRQGQQFLRGPRPRRLSLKRRRRRRMVTGITVTMLILLSSMAGWMLGAQLLHFVRSSPAFCIVELEMDDYPRVDRSELTALTSTVARRANIFSTHLGRLAREVEKHRWVRSCSIKRILPDRLHIRLQEKVPAGLARHGDRLLLVDGQGAVIEEPPASESWRGEFPLLTGFSGDAEWEAHQGRVRKSLGLVELLQHLEQRQDIPRVAEIDMSDPSNTRIWFIGRAYPVLMGDEDFTDKLARYRLIEKTIEERHGGNLQYVDLRFRERVIVKPDPGTEEEGRS
jgi:cell division septal protein FtsQ